MSDIDALKRNQDARVILALHLDDLSEGKAVDFDEVYEWWESLVDSCAEMSSAITSLRSEVAEKDAERLWLAQQLHLKGIESGYALDRGGRYTADDWLRAARGAAILTKARRSADD